MRSPSADKLLLSWEGPDVSTAAGKGRVSGYGAALIAARTELQRTDASLFRHYMSRRESREEERL